MLGMKKQDRVREATEGCTSMPLLCRATGVTSHAEVVLSSLSSLLTSAIFNAESLGKIVSETIAYGECGPAGSFFPNLPSPSMLSW
jgi:hypothetical protein